MVLDYIYRNWKIRYRYSKKVDDVEVESDVYIPLFPQIEADVANGVVNIDIVPGDLENLYSLSVNGYGDKYNWLTYLSDIHLDYLGNSSVLTNGSVTFYYNPNLYEKSNVVNAIRGLPKDADYSLTIPLGKADGAKKCFRINLDEYRGKKLPVGPSYGADVY